MNLLAHIYLSGDSEEIMIGNFIADFIRGNKYKHYDMPIIQGIKLHRKIDAFTDTHPGVKQSIKRIQADYSKYSGVIMDVFYDHLLARNFKYYAEQELHLYAQEKYLILEKHQAILPPKVQEFLPSMIRQNWLVRYSDLEGIEQALRALSRRSKYAKNLEKAISYLKSDYDTFEQDFRQFFPELINYSQFIQKNELYDL